MQIQLLHFTCIEMKALSIILNEGIKNKSAITLLGHDAL